MELTKEITLDYIKSQIRTIPDFPSPGINFKDITTIIKDGEMLRYLTGLLYDIYKDKNITKVVGIESRGFILGAGLAANLNAGFVPLRKCGKLPAKTYSESYELEYGKNTVEIHQDALSPHDVVLIHDDLLATGGTAKAALSLVKRFRVKAVYFNFLCELDFLKGRQKFNECEVKSLIHF